MAPDGDEDHRFGMSVAHEDDRLMIGAKSVRDVMRGVAPPHVHDVDASIFALQFGYQAVERILNEKDLFGPSMDRPVFAYLAATAHMPHKQQPGDMEGMRFIVELDRIIEDFNKMGAMVGLTSTTGLTDKMREGDPHLDRDANDAATGGALRGCALARPPRRTAQPHGASRPGSRPSVRWAPAAHLRTMGTSDAFKARSVASDIFHTLHLIIFDLRPARSSV